MNASLRMILVALVLGLLTLGVFGLRFACSPSDFLEEGRRNEQLQRLRWATDRRMEARQQAVQEWIAQHRTLAETINRLQELDHEWPDYITPQRKFLPSDEERLYRFLIAHIEDTFLGQPEELAAVRRRLEEDYQQLQASGRTPTSAENGKDKK